MKTTAKKTDLRPEQPLLREKVREVLALAPSRRFSERMILDAVNRLIPIEATLDEVKQAMEWNHDRGLIDYAFNHDEERDEWTLTRRGRDKEGIK